MHGDAVAECIEAVLVGHWWGGGGDRVGQGGGGAQEGAVVELRRQARRDKYTIVDIFDQLHMAERLSLAAFAPSPNDHA